ncbi:hypothetical protein D3C81_1321210 [compost metagenome]
MIDFGQLPGVFVKVHVALGIDMPLPRFERGLYMPDTMQLITRQVLVDVPRFDDVVVLEFRRLQLVVVVGDVHLLLANQLPVIAVRRAVHHVGVIGGAHAVRAIARAVVGHLRCTPHPALAGVVDPGQAGFLDLIDGFVDQHHAAGQTRRCGDFLLVVVKDVIALPLLDVVHQLRKSQGIVVFNNRVGAVGLRCRLGRLARHVAATVAIGVVPVDFNATFRDREWVVAGLGKMLQAVAIRRQLSSHRTFFGNVVDVLRRGRCTLGLVHRNLVAVRVALEQGQLARGEFVLVLLGVGGGNHQQRFVIGEWITEKAVVQRRSAGLEATGPGRNATVGIGLFLGPQRGQGSAQLGSLLRRNGGHYATGQQ